MPRDSAEDEAVQRKTAEAEKAKAAAAKAMADAEAAAIEQVEAASAANQARAEQLRRQQQTARAGRDRAEAQLEKARATGERKRREEQEVRSKKDAEERAAAQEQATAQAAAARRALEFAAEKQHETQVAPAAQGVSAIDDSTYDDHVSVGADTSSSVSSVSSDDPLAARLHRYNEAAHAEEDRSQLSVVSTGATAESWAAQSLDGIAQTIEQEIDATMKIQAVQRGRKDRKEVRARKAKVLEDKLGLMDGPSAEQEMGAVKIQTIRRGQLAQREVLETRTRVLSARKIQSVQRGKRARIEVEAKRKELGERIFAQILSFDSDNNGFIDASEFKIYLKATGQWGTDELYTDGEWNDSWPIVCELLGVEDRSIGMPVDAFVRYTEKYRSDALNRDLRALEGADLEDLTAESDATGPEPEPEVHSPHEPEPEPEPEPSVCFALASEKMKDQEFAEAAELYTEAARSGHPKPAMCHVSAGTCWNLCGDSADEDCTKAIDAYTAALETEAGNGRALRGRAESYRRASMWTEAKADLENLQNIDAKIIGNLYKQVVAEAAEQEAASRKIQAVRRGNAARKQLDEARTPEESRRLRDLRGNTESSAAAKEAFALAGKQLQDGDFASAAESYERTIRLGYSRPSRCHNGAGVALSLMGEQELLALEQFSAAIALDADDPRVYHNRAAVYKRLNRFPEAARDAALAHLMDPHDIVTRRLAALSAAEVCAVKIQAIARGRHARATTAADAASKLRLARM